MDKSTKELLAQAEKLCAQRNVRRMGWLVKKMTQHITVCGFDLMYKPLFQQKI